MGQQLRFETLNAVANGLDNAELKKGRRPDYRAPSVRIVAIEPKKPRLEPGKASAESEKLRIARVELLLTTETAQLLEVDLYEAYWAPLTEGKIRDRDVVGFMLAAGRNGFKRGREAFRRLMFGETHEFPVPRPARFKTVAAFAGALLVFLALIAIQGVIAAVAAARLFAGAGTVAWPSDALFLDLTVDLVLLLIVGAAMGGALIYTSSRRKRQKGHDFWRPWTPNPLLIATCWTLVYLALSATVVIALLMLVHIVRSRTGATDAAWLALWHSITRTLAPFIPASAARFAEETLPNLWGVERVPAAIVFVVWLAAYWASQRARWFFRQYLGDVAIYVSSHTLDTFWETRQAIKECVNRVGKAVYEAGENGEFLYDRVIVVGHSLGSVVAYDMLNELVQDDAVNAYPTSVAERTHLFLTFGSPLDKIAFVFGTQRPNREVMEHALTAAVQPLISRYDDGWRPRSWRNIYSPQDWISGDVNYFDTAREADMPPHLRHKRVVNKRDPEAATPLLAHNEYWDGAAFVETLYDALTDDGQD